MLSKFIIKSNEALYKVKLVPFQLHLTSCKVDPEIDTFTIIEVFEVVIPFCGVGYVKLIIGGVVSLKKVMLVEFKLPKLSLQYTVQVLAPYMLVIFEKFVPAETTGEVHRPELLLHQQLPVSLEV
jgi:hypothetical protein